MLAGSLTASVPGPDDYQFRPARVVREITMPNSNVEMLLMIFVGITAVAVLLQACVLLGMFLIMRKAIVAGKEEVAEFRAKLIPVLDSSKELMESGQDVIRTAKDLMKTASSLITDLEPHLESAATELANMARDVHQQTNQLQAAVDQVALKARRQVDRVDHMATSTLNGLERFGSFVNEAVNLPVRQLSGVIAAAKAVVGTLRTPAPPRPRRAGPPASVADEKDLFV
jgi:methyl-accepting chemotaxis protein